MFIRELQLLLVDSTSVSNSRKLRPKKHRKTENKNKAKHNKINTKQNGKGNGL